MGLGEPKRLRLRRQARIRTGREFARIRSEGHRVTTGCLIGNWRLLPTESCSRLGVITSSKIGSAVIRSRARRLLREVFRRHQGHMDRPAELVLVARPSIVGMNFAQVEKHFLTMLQKAGLLKY